jgi:hypothetical protein
MRKDRLPACDKWHPDMPSDLITHNYNRYRSSGIYYSKRRKCRICDKLWRRDRTLAPKPLPTHGVLLLPRLTWTPTEGITHDGSC